MKNKIQTSPIVLTKYKKREDFDSQELNGRWANIILLTLLYQFLNSVKIFNKLSFSSAVPAMEKKEWESCPRITEVKSSQEVCHFHPFFKQKKGN